MKNSKLFITSLIAAAAMTSTAFASGDANTILVNFASGNGHVFNVENDEVNGTWNNLTGASNSAVQSLTAADGTTGAGTITWNSKNSWEYTTNVTDEMLKGYLDDGNGITINVTTNFLIADVTVYCATDSNNATFSAKTVNGSTYTYDSGTSQTVLGSGSWGTAKTATPVEGTNALTISGVIARSISIASAANSSGQGVRGCIAGLKIVDAGVKVATTISTDTTWTNESLAGTAWTNATDTNKTYAGITISGTANLNITGDAVTAIGVLVDGEGTLTLSGNELKLISAGVIKTSSDSANLVINNTLKFTNGGMISGNVTFGDNASLTVGENKTLVLSNGVLPGAATLVSTTLNRGSKIAIDASNAASVDLSKVTGGETSRVAIKASGSADSFTAISNLRSFSGSIEITGGYLKLNTSDLISGLSAAKSVVLSGGNSSGLVFLRASNLNFDKDIIAEGAGGALRSYGSDGYSVNFTGSVTGTSITHVDGGTHTFSGTVNLNTFNANAGVTNFSGNTTLGTLNYQGGSALNFSQNSISTVGAFSATGTHSMGIAGVLNITGDKTGVSQDTASFMMANGGGKNTITIQDGGVLNLASAGLSVRDGDAELNIATGGEANFGKGLHLIANSGDWGANVLNLNGGTLNVGSSGTWTGITTDGKSNVKVNLNSGTLGSLADSWSSSLDFVLGGQITVDTTKKQISNSVKATEVSGQTGSTVTLSGVLSGVDGGAGALTKDGAGTLILSGANTFTGGVAINAGTLQAGNASALGTGAVKIAGGQLSVASGVTLNQTAIEIVLSDKYKSDSGVAAITGSGSITLNGTTIKLSKGELDSLTTVTEMTFKIADASISSSFTKDNFTLGTGWDGWTITSYTNGVITLSVPEPSMFGLLAGLGALALVGARRRRKTK